jgi:light-regulated signal transduction histidine kinase (bacteriophytochrome)
MWVCHRVTGRFLAVNEAALRLYGYRRQEFLELSLTHLSAERPSDSGTACDQVSTNRHRKKDGASLDLEQIWHPCQFEGEPAYLVTMRETGAGSPEPEREGVLEHKVADCSHQLEAAQRDLETFSYSVSHDLQAPLRHIDGFSRALMDDYGEKLDPQAHEYLLRICQAASKMSQLIDAVQKLSRVARSEPDRQSVNLSVAAQVISLELRHGQPQRRVEFVIQEEVSADADPRLARQLLEVLIGNAWKFTSGREPALIEFGNTQVQNETAYFVRDNGVGFDMAYADKLFSIFHRLHRADEFEGAGVGLAIAKRIVERHGGRIWAESAQGQGATFYFTL